ncbi:DUF805 domain-containing protein [Marmoricola sp. URHB0036]|uniref:DUF805 domain-containing protein n=1 Tax=Marmoricola sp. URHB0036 TaxID=1298863 RepID=UPI0004278E89|nr:DUF805 domain-containing protein [Marmoricola sp. URHB0036]
MTFTQAVRSALGNYATFSGRARRSEYWWFYLFTILVSLATSGVDSVLRYAFDNEVGVVNTIASLALLLPSLAVTARRLHDTGRTGWWMVLPVVPVLATVVVGFAALFTIVFSAVSSANDISSAPVLATVALFIACALCALVACVTLLVFLCLDSEPGANRYGLSPKQPVAPTGPLGHYPPSTSGSDSPPWQSREL